MKENWETPRTIIEHFVPNEYIATCKDKWTMTCDARAGKGVLFDDKNNNGVFDPMNYEMLYVGSGCGRTFDITLGKGEVPSPNALFVELTGSKSTYPVYYINAGGHYHIIRTDKGDFHPKNLS